MQSPTHTPARAAKPNPPATPAAATAGDDSGDEDEVPNVEALKAFAAQVQRAPSSSGFKKVVIPKRGEKDFEPLDETVNLQEKMLRESRQAYFDGLSGVRGSSNKNVSHAILRHDASFVQVKIPRGSMFLTTGHTIRAPVEEGSKKKEPPLELLPEESLYMLERGSMQIWHQPPGVPDMEWDEELHGFRGGWEMSTMEAFSLFLGQEGLTAERYQAYASLRRLGYVVQRTEPFLPPRFRKPAATTEQVPIENSSSSSIISSIWTGLLSCLRSLRASFLRLLPSRAVTHPQTLLGDWNGTTYGALYSRLRITQTLSGRNEKRLPLKDAEAFTDAAADDATLGIYEPLKRNPYLPFFHVWKPNSNWSRSKWDKGSELGLRNQPPSFWVGVVDARMETIPSYEQIHDIFPTVPHVPAPFLRPRNPPTPPSPEPWSVRLMLWLGKESKPEAPKVNMFADLKQGDRNVIVAVNDGGNIGWVKLCRGTFQDHDLVPWGM